MREIHAATRPRFIHFGDSAARKQSRVNAMTRKVFFLLNDSGFMYALGKKSEYRPSIRDRRRR
ncbi:MAG: hypothetical protein ACK51V_01535 [bacterium]